MTVAPGPAPRSAWPSGESGESTSYVSLRSSIEPTRYVTGRRRRRRSGARRARPARRRRRSTPSITTAVFSICSSWRTRASLCALLVLRRVVVGVLPDVAVLARAFDPRARSRAGASSVRSSSSSRRRSYAWGERWELGHGRQGTRRPIEHGLTCVVTDGLLRSWSYAMTLRNARLAHRHRHSVSERRPGVRSQPSTPAWAVFSWQGTTDREHHRVGIIGGDGIGPEVIGGR